LPRASILAVSSADLTAVAVLGSICEIPGPSTQPWKAREHRRVEIRRLEQHSCHSNNSARFGSAIPRMKRRTHDFATPSLRSDHLEFDRRIDCKSSHRQRRGHPSFGSIQIMTVLLTSRKRRRAASDWFDKLDTDHGRHAQHQGTAWPINLVKVLQPQTLTRTRH